VFPDFATGNSREKSGAVETLLLRIQNPLLKDQQQQGRKKERCSTCPK
jgi:hypothetical protein